MHSFNFFYIHFTLCEHFDGISDIRLIRSTASTIQCGRNFLEGRKTLSITIALGNP